mmetsp:Transcript_22914/g.74747  ORF Transcript_22914/g.74747 Transcript_22914/m.74747 type:complete len:270 (-) Transcript_22914:59-868(-)
MHIAEEVEQVPNRKAHEVEDVEPSAHHAVISEKKPREVDSLDIKEAEDAHLSLGVSSGPHPHDGVEQRLRQERQPRDLSPVLLVHPHAQQPHQRVEQHERNPIEQEMPEVLSSLAVVKSLHGLGVVEHEDSLHQHVVTDRTEVGEGRDEAPDLQLEDSWPVEDERLGGHVDGESLPADEGCDDTSKEPVASDEWMAEPPVLYRTLLPLHSHNLGLRGLLGPSSPQREVLMRQDRLLRLPCSRFQVKLQVSTCVNIRSMQSLSDGEDEGS